MKKLLEWIEQKKQQHGNIVVLLSALVLFTLLALLMTLVYALVIGLIYIDPYLVLVLTFFLLVLIVYKNRAR
jgi:Flp pilus assembly protein TadB